MSEPGSYQSPSLSYVKAQDRKDAVRRMILPDPLLSKLYDEGKQKDGKSGWVNAIRDQSGAAYRLLFYIDKMPLAKDYSELEPYEVLYGAITDSDEVNYPRALYTTTGAINLMRDGIPGKRFVDALLRGILEIVPYELGRDIKAEHLRESGYAYICIYDRDGQGIRILDLLDYLMVYDNRRTDEIQVHQEHELVVGDTKFVRPFLLRYAVSSESSSESTRGIADAALKKFK